MVSPGAMFPQYRRVMGKTSLPTAASREGSADAMHGGPGPGVLPAGGPAGIDRREFVWSAIRGSLGLAAGFALPARLLAQAASAAAPVRAPAGTRFQQPESTRRMAALLAKITREADPLRNPFRN